jgi:predicted O-methyltransferase YrrM
MLPKSGRELPRIAGNASSSLVRHDGAIPTLPEYFRDLKLAEDAWHVGPEHPSLEDLGLALLASSSRTRILEIGVQSGDFAVPVILASAGRRGFSYLGVDNREYTNAVPLNLISDYLALHGISQHVRFIEDNSSRVLKTGQPFSFDLILLDHYKPKYASDLYCVCARDLLSEDGAIVLHNVLTHAASAWNVCRRVCRAFRYTWKIDASVRHGAAIVRRGETAQRSRIAIIAAYLEVTLRWHTHATVLRLRRAVGRLLRDAGLR